MTEPWAAPRVAISAGAVPFRPSNGVYAVVGPPVDGAALIECSGVAGAWQFTDEENDRVVTLAFVDGDLWQASDALTTAAARGLPRRPNGPGHSSVLMPSAGTGSLR